MRVCVCLKEKIWRKKGTQSYILQKSKILEDTLPERLIFCETL